MFRLELFKIRAFSAGNLASLFSSMSRGGVLIMLIILLQGIWLPLHGYSFDSTPFWAGIFMIPMSIGFVLTGPISGWLSDKHGARLLATLGMVISAVAFIGFVLLPVNFIYMSFATVLFIMGIGGGIFASPNMASIMNSVPAEHRGAASGMRATIQNSAMTISQAIFFTIIIVSLSASLPGALSAAVTSAGAHSAACTYLQCYASLSSPLRLISRLQPSRNNTSYPSGIVSEHHTNGNDELSHGINLLPKCNFSSVHDCTERGVHHRRDNVRCSCSLLRAKRRKIRIRSKKTRGKGLEVLHSQYFFKRFTCK